ncbi:MAG: tetratricopeptide repeat protein [Clostridia bacterium]|nr:tetratricopeptide repeat protein [Clostridia bacterium]
MPNNPILSPEDYLEPACLLCGDPLGAAETIKPIPQQRVIEKMDEYMSRRDYAGAGQHLLYWLAEAQAGRDKRGELMVRNELVGHYRKVGDREKAFESAGEALRLLGEIGFDGSVSAGTTYTNIATAYNAFGENALSLSYFEKAKTVYEANANTDPRLLGGLYNNMALVKTALGEYDEAYALYEKALAAMAKVPGGGLEQAITYLNKADTVTAQLGAEAAETQVCELLDRAWELLDRPDAPQDGYYAFVCEKCAPTFSFYGYFLAAKELERRAKEIYGRTASDNV